MQIPFNIAELKPMMKYFLTKTSWIFLAKIYMKVLIMSVFDVGNMYYKVYNVHMNTPKTESFKSFLGCFH